MRARGNAFKLNFKPASDSESEATLIDSKSDPAVGSSESRCCRILPHNNFAGLSNDGGGRRPPTEFDFPSPGPAPWP